MSCQEQSPVQLPAIGSDAGLGTDAAPVCKRSNMTAATVLLDLLSCCAAGTELFGNEPPSDFCDSCSFFVLFSRKGSCCVFILLARTGSSWGDTGKVGGVPLKELNLFSLRSLWLKTKLLSSKRVLPT